MKINWNKIYKTVSTYTIVFYLSIGTLSMLTKAYITHNIQFITLGWLMTIVAGSMIHQTLNRSDDNAENILRSN